MVTAEIRPELWKFAKKNLKKYRNIFVLNQDGREGWKKEAPYDRIIVTASATKIPDALTGQLKENGIMIIPLGDEMYKIEKTKKGIKKTFLGYFAFVKLKEP